jgi:hypothetical protein
MGNRGSPRISEAYAPVSKLLNRVAALVYETMVTPTQENQVGEPRLAASCPVPDVVSVEKTAVLAAWEPAAPVARLKRPAHRGRDRACPPPDRERLAVMLHDLNDRGVAGQPPRRLPRERWPVFQRAAAAIGRGEGGRIDVHDHLIALPTGAALRLTRECRLGQRDERIRVRRPRPRPRFRGTALAGPFALLEPVARHLERSQEECAVLGRKASPDDERAVRLPAIAHVRSRLELARFFSRDAAEGADRTLQLRGGQVTSELEELFFVLPVGNSRQRPDLGVGELSACEGHLDERKLQ